MRYKQILMYMSITNYSDQEIRCQCEKNYLLLYNVMTMHLSLKLLICRMKLRTIRPIGPIPPPHTHPWLPRSRGIEASIVCRLNLTLFIIGRKLMCMNIHTKQRTNVSIDKTLLEEAREKNLKLSPIFEEALRRRLKEERAARWLEENKEVIENYNEEVEKHGVFSDGIRSF
jgi:antitoxin CcdA